MYKQRRVTPRSTSAVEALLSQYREHLTREEAADAITRHFFPIKRRTLERWKVPVTHLNGKACLATRDVFEEAQRRVDAAACIAA